MHTHTHTQILLLLSPALNLPPVDLSRIKRNVCIISDFTFTPLLDRQTSIVREKQELILRSSAPSTTGTSLRTRPARLIMLIAGTLVLSTLLTLSHGQASAYYGGIIETKAMRMKNTSPRPPSLKPPPPPPPPPGPPAYIPPARKPKASAPVQEDELPLIYVRTATQKAPISIIHSGASVQPYGEVVNRAGSENSFNRRSYFDEESNFQDFEGEEDQYHSASGGGYGGGGGSKGGGGYGGSKGGGSSYKKVRHRSLSLTSF